MNVDGRWLKRIDSIEIGATARAATSVNSDTGSAPVVGAARLFCGLMPLQCAASVSMTSLVLVVGRRPTR